MFPAQQALGEQQFAVDADDVQQLLTAGTDVMGDRLQPGGGQAVRQLLQQRPDVRVTHQGNPLLSFLRIDQQRCQPVQANRRLFMIEYRQQCQPVTRVAASA